MLKKNLGNRDRSDTDKQENEVDDRHVRLLYGYVREVKKVGVH